VQIVEELRGLGRDVFLAGGKAGRVPRRYRGRDIFWWLWALANDGAQYGTSLPTVDQLPDPRRRLAANPQLSGHRGGYDIDLRRIGRDGTTILGRLVGIDGEHVTIAPDVRANLAFADGLFEERYRGLIDRYIDAAGIDCPPAEPAATIDYEPPIVEHLDLVKAGIGTVLWTAGYRQSLGWIEPSMTDDMGFARQSQGVSQIPGLFFIGSLWQHDQASATLFGVQRDAQVLAERMGLTRGVAQH